MTSDAASPRPWYKKRGCGILLYLILLGASYLTQALRFPAGERPPSAFTWEHLTPVTQPPALRVFLIPDAVQSLQMAPENFPREANVYRLEIQQALPDESDFIPALIQSIVALTQGTNVPVAIVGMGTSAPTAMQIAQNLDAQALVLVEPFAPEEFVLLRNTFLNQSIRRLRSGFWKICDAGLPHFGWGTAFRERYHQSVFAQYNTSIDLRQTARDWKGTTRIYLPPEVTPLDQAIAAEFQRVLPGTIVLPHPATTPWDCSSAPMTAPTLQQQAAAATPYDPRSTPPIPDSKIALILALLALCTFASEDLTCLGAGILIANGTLSFFQGTLACLVGIFIGDGLLYVCGRFIGQPLLNVAPFRWMISKSQLARSATWFNEKGGRVILLSRFTPGLRTPTYVASGTLGLSFARFVGWFLLAAALWTPTVVWLCSLLADQMLVMLQHFEKHAVWLLIGFILVITLLRKLILPLCSKRGRRLLYGEWKRLTCWEFWPAWAVYPPVLWHIVKQGIRHRNFWAFTACNPGMPASGFVGESKADILAAFGTDHPDIARWERVSAASAPSSALAQVESFMERHAFSYPVVLKPDQGQRGEGVTIAQNRDAVTHYFAECAGDQIVQEYIPGREFGVFYIRHPEEAVGRIFAITDKQMIQVVGDGKQTLEWLILSDARAVCKAGLHFKTMEQRLLEVPPAGQVIPLTQLGTHALGALFLEGKDLNSDALTAKIDAISKCFDGFYLGRYDIRVPDANAFRAGQQIKVIELNGVTSEPTNMYDPRYRLRDARDMLREQWTHACDIGMANIRAKKAKACGPIDLLRRYRAYLDLKA